MGGDVSYLFHVIQLNGAFLLTDQQSLKAVLLHNGNKFPFIPLAHSVHLKKNYDSIKMLLTAIKYMEYKW